MNTGLWIVSDFLVILVLVYTLYLFGRVYIPRLAEKDIFFSSPKLGRIKARRRSGRIIGFFDNLVGKNKHVNDQGVIENGEVLPTGFWWKFFGVRFIGLDDVYTYKIATEVEEQMDGTLKYKEEPASSIYYEGSYPMTTLPMTKDGVRLKLKLQLKTSTEDAAKGLSLPISWTKPMFASVLAATRDFCGTREIATLISSQNEGEYRIGKKKLENSGFVKLILSLNDTIAGNVSMKDICGQHIDAVNIVDVDFADEDTKKAFSAPFEAKKAAQKIIEDAKAQAKSLVVASEAELAAAKNIAEAIREKGSAVADVYGLKHTNIGADPEATAKVIVSENQSTMKNLTTLVNGGGSIVSTPTK